MAQYEVVKAVCTTIGTILGIGGLIYIFYLLFVPITNKDYAYEIKNCGKVVKFKNNIVTFVLKNDKLDFRRKTINISNLAYCYIEPIGPNAQPILVKYTRHFKNPFKAMCSAVKDIYILCIPKGTEITGFDYSS